MSHILIYLFIIVIANFGFGLGASILFLPMHMTASHKISMLPLADELANHGHQVTFWNTFFEKQPIKPGNKGIIDRDFVTTTTNQQYNEQWVWHNGSDFMNTWTTGELKPWNFFMLFGLGTDICKHGIDQYWDQIDGIISENFDLLIIDTLFTPCGMIIAERSRVPKILFSTIFSMPFTNRHLSIPQPIDSFTAITIDYDKTKFWHRLQQFVIWYLYDVISSHMIQMRYHWSLAKVWPATFDWKRFDQSALYSFNLAAVTIVDPIPAVPDSFSLGDTPCHDGSPPTNSSLPDEYRRFVEETNSLGTIVAAFGHIVNWKTAPRSDIMQLHQAFNRLGDYRVLWQYNGDPLPELPNLKTATWLPQKEILYHPKTKLFISHMGLKSVMEGLCAEVPFVALPVYAEQPFNSRMLIHRHKTGTILNKKKLLADDIVAKLSTVLQNSAYQKRISNLRKIMNDRPMNPLEDGVWRVNFVLNHQEKANLWRIKGRRLNWPAYYNLDVIGSTISITAIAIFGIFKLLSGF